MESMGVATGCGCKEVYRFPHTTYPYSSCIYMFFLQQQPYFFVLFFYVFRSLQIGTIKVHGISYQKFTDSAAP